MWMKVHFIENFYVFYTSGAGRPHENQCAKLTTGPHHQILQASASNILQRFANALVLLYFLHYFLFIPSTALVCEAKTSDQAPD